MADFMSKVVASTIVKEGVNRAVSFVFGKGEEQESQEHNVERLNMAVSALELALERTGKLPITDISLIRRWHVFKQAYIEGIDLLNKHIQRKEEMEQRVKRKRWNIPVRAKNIFVSSPAAACLSTDDVRRFTWLADCADKFVRDVESGCSLRHYTFCSPLVRHLLQGKTFWSEIDEGSRLRRFYMRPICFEGRGVETLLGYHYDDREMAEKGFGLNLVLRLSESTDIVGTTIKCLQSMTSHYEQVNQTALGELTLLANLQDTPQHDSPSSEGIQNLRKYTQVLRPDPVCCKGDGRGPCAKNIISPRLSHMFPEQVIYFSYHYCVPAPDYSFSSMPADQAAKSLMRGRRQPLGMRVAFLHYFVINKQKDSYTFDITSRENSHELRYDNIQQVTAETQLTAQTGSSCTINCFLLQPELTEHHISWFSRHGLACFHRIKPIIERAGTSKTSLIRSKTAKKRKEEAAGN